MAKSPTKPAMMNLVPPVWAIVYSLIALALHFFWPARLTLFLPNYILAGIVTAAGLGIIIWAWSLFQKEKTDINPASLEHKKLITYGPYRYTRNPMYLGLVTVLTGLAFFFGTIPFILAPVALFLTLNNVFIPYEESALEKGFGKVYRDYKDQVRKWL